MNTSRLSASSPAVLSAVLTLMLAGYPHLGCNSGGGSQSYPDAVSGTGSGGRGVVGGGGQGAPVTGSGGHPSDAGATSDAAAANPDGPPAAGAIRVLPGPSALLGPGPSCSSSTPAANGTTPDRWCAAVRPGTAAGTLALVVFNLTQAMAGTAVTCGAGDVNCLQLSASITGDAPHQFFGDVLVYYEAQAVSAWRPGWTGGRMLVPQDQTLLASCVTPPAAVPTALCLRATTDARTFNLFAGRIDTQSGGALTLVEPITADTSGAAFSPDFQSVVWSTRATTAAPEVLKMQTIGDAATRRTVASNVTGWAQSADGLRWLWLAQPVTSAAGLVTGTLQTAPFPAGTAPTNVHPAVLTYTPFASKGVIVLATPGTLGADLKAISDLDAPTTSAAVIETQTATEFTDVTADGTVLYSTDFVQPNATDPTFFLINLLTARANGAGKCTVTATPVAAPSASLTVSGTAVAWARLNAGGTAVEGVFTSLATCTPQVFSTGLADAHHVSDGIIVQQNYNDAAFSAYLGFIPFLPMATDMLGAIVTIHQAANPTIASLFPASPRVVYSVTQTMFEGGIYVSGALTGSPPTVLPFYAGAPGLGAGDQTARTTLQSSARARLAGMGRAARAFGIGSRSLAPASSRALLSTNSGPAIDARLVLRQRLLRAGPFTAAASSPAQVRPRMPRSASGR